LARPVLLRGGGRPDPRLFSDRLAKQLAAVPGFQPAVLASIGQQITIEQNVTGEHAVLTAIGSLTVHTISTQEHFRAVVLGPLGQVLRGDLTLVFLVDGLDQALGDSAPPTVLDLVQSLLGIEGVRMLVGTRKEGRILQRLSTGRTPTRLDLSAPSRRPDIDRDVGRYVERRLSELHLSPEEADVERLVRIADGNFAFVGLYLDEVQAGQRALGDLDSLPPTLHGLYDQYLARARSTYGDRWDAELQPLLALIGIARPAAPTALLAGWLGAADGADVNRRLTDLGPLVVLDEALGGWRVYHHSMAEFLAMDTVSPYGEPTANAWYIDPSACHRRLGLHYLAAAASNWQTVDDYGLENTVYHLAMSVRLAPDSVPSKELLARLPTIVTSSDLRAAQQERLRPHAELVGLRPAVDVIGRHGDMRATLDLAKELATDSRPVVRAVAVDVLVEAMARDEMATTTVLRGLLTGPVGPARRAAISAAARIGVKASGLFVEIALGEDLALRRAAAIALYLRWRPDGTTVTSELLTKLSEEVKLLTRPGRLQSVLEFLSDLSILLYIQRCEDAKVASETSELWKRVLKDRLHLGMVNRPALEGLLLRAISGGFARRMLETAVLSDEQAALDVFRVTDSDRATVKRVLPALDPAVDPTGMEEDLGLLLGAKLNLLRVLGAMVLDVQAHQRLEPTAALAERLFDSTNGTARAWVLLGFGCRLGAAPPGWLEVVEGLTRRFLDEEPALFYSAGSSSLTQLDLTLLPVIEAYAGVGAEPILVRQLIESATSSGDAGRLARVIEALTPAGPWHPHMVLQMIEPAVRTTTPGTEIDGALLTCLGPLRAVHPQFVDEMLATVAPTHLRESVLATDEVEAVWRHLWWLGLYKNAVHQALRYPRMRSQLLQGGLTAIVDAASPKDFLKDFAPVPLRMLRECDYDLLCWTRP
jgi:hypothetical protein